MPTASEPPNELSVGVNAVNKSSTTDTGYSWLDARVQTGTTDDGINQINPWEYIVIDEMFSRDHEITVERDIPRQSIEPGAGLQLTIPTDTFAHTDKQARLTLMATLNDGSPLPGWLTFEPTTGQLSGTPPPTFQGEIQVRIAARDNAGRQAETIVSIQSANPTNETPSSTSGDANTAGNPGSAELITTTTGFITLVDPNGAVDGKHDLRVHKGIPDLELDQNTSEIRYQIPIDAFIHTDASAEVELSALMPDGSPLPRWLIFDAEKGEIRGKIPPDFKGELLIRIIAQDKEGRKTETTLKIVRKGQVLELQTLLQGRPELDSQLDANSVLAWRAEQSELVRQAREAAMRLEQLAKAS